MDLPRLVMRRAAIVAVLGCVVLALAGLARMRDDVDEELSGARGLATLAEQLNGLALLDDAQASQALRHWQAQAELRHLQVRVTDGAGRLMLQAGPGQADEPSGWLARLGQRWFVPAAPFSVSWALRRPQGPAWSVTLTAAPWSEQAEAVAALLESLAVLAAVAAGVLLVMAWNTRRAFRPLGQLLSALSGLERSHEGGRRQALPVMPIAELEALAAAVRHLDVALAAAQQHRRHLARQLMSLQEDERGRLARELHDEFGQRLTAMRVNTTWLGRQLQGQPELLAVVRDIGRQCEAVQQDVRGLLQRLRPLGPAAEDEPETLAALARMLHTLVAGWQRALPSLRWTLDIRQGEPGLPARTLAPDEAGCGLPRDAALALYRISQEALTNVARHAVARQATLALRVELPAGRPEDGPALATWHWSVQDDGVGLEALDTACSRGNGLAGMRERLWALGGDLHWEAVPAGTCLTAVLQLPTWPAAAGAGPECAP